MDVGKALINILNADSAITALIGAGGSATGIRCFPSAYRVPATMTTPFMTYQVVSDVPNNTKNGVSEYDYVTVQINVYDTGYEDLQTLVGLVRTALDYVSGTYNGVVVDKIFFEGGSDAFDDTFGDNGIYQYSVDFRFNLNM